MKQIEIKTHKEIKFTEDEKLSYKHLILMTINKAPAGGFSYKDNKIRAKIEEAVESAKAGLVIMEDEHFDELLKLAKDMTWGFRTTFTNEFVDDLEAAKSVTPADLSDLKSSKNGKANKLEPVK